MPLSLSHRRIGDVTVVTCHGRIVEGPESAGLQQLLDIVVPSCPHVILHLADVVFIDSSGMGLLMRYLARTRNAQGDLILCALSPRVAEVLETTHLRPIFGVYDSEGEAITAACLNPLAAATARLRATVVCVDPSAFVQTYVRELLTQAGYGVLTAGNLPDAVVLLQAARPKIIVVSEELRRVRDTRWSEKFNTLADARTVIELPADFSRRDAGEAGGRLLDQIRASHGNA